MVQLLPGNGVVVVRVVVDAFLVGVTSVIKKNTTSCDTVLSPVVDGAFVVCGRSCDIRTFGAVVERSGRDVSKVAEAVPLGPGLRVQMVQIVVRDAI